MTARAVDSLPSYGACVLRGASRPLRDVRFSTSDDELMVAAAAELGYDISMRTSVEPPPFSNTRKGGFF